MRIMYLTFLLVMAVSTTGCLHDDNDSPAVNNDTSTPMTGNMDPDPGNSKTDFSVFAKKLVSMVAENTDPVDIDSITFEFNENRQAFDDVL